MEVSFEYIRFEIFRRCCYENAAPSFLRPNRKWTRPNQPEFYSSPGMFSIKSTKRWAAIVGASALAFSSYAQTPAPLIDMGAAAPVPGPLDIVQLSTNGDISHPDGLNYYTDNQTGHNAGEPGQTFTTPNSTNAFVLISLALKSAGLSDGGGSPGTSINYLLHIYSVSGANVSPLAAYSSPSLVYTEGDWLLWSNLSVTLLPGSTYAYSFGKSNNTAGWDAIGVASPNPYSFGEIALVPPSGGGMTFSSSHSYDASFDIGLVPAGSPTPPVVTNSAPTGIEATATTLNGRIVSNGMSLPVVTIYYGTTDGSTNAGAWQNAVSIGGQSAAFALTVPGLSPNTTYFYTASASNSAAIAWAAPSKSFTTLVSNTVPTPIAVLTYHNDNTRDGANTNETALTPANVNSGSFGRLFSYPLDGHVYAQPLVLTNVSIQGQGVHDVVYVVTEHDTAYALDADSNQGANGGVLWSNHLGTSAPTPNNDFADRYGPYHDLVPEVGITGTPVIDPVAGTIYFDAFTLDGTNSSGAHVYNHRIHALDITTGIERPYAPVLVAATFPGTGIDSSNGVVTFTPTQQAQRPAFTLAGGTLYIAYGSYADTDPYHGWAMSFNPTNLQLLSIFNTTPNATVANFGTNAGEGAIWMGGNGLEVDSNTNLYFETANGSFSANTNGVDYGDAFMKLSTSNGLNVVDYFSPSNQASLAAGDEDLGSGGSILLPDSVGSVAHPHLMIGAGKGGTLYLVDRDNLGRYSSSNNNNVQQVISAIKGVWGTPAYFNHLIYYLANGDVFKEFAITNGVITGTPLSKSSTAEGFPGGEPAISANGTANAIAWVIQTDAYTGNGPAILHAYNATNLAQELYNSSQNLARDNPGGAVKFTVPTVADGKVYVGAEYKLSVFGNGIFLTAPAIVPNGGGFNGSVSVTLSGAPAGVNIYYTVNGSTPSTNSLLYTGPFALTNSATINALAAAPGAVNSVVTTASFVVVPPIYFTAEQFLTNGQFQLQFSGANGGGSYVLEASTNLTDWVPLLTNTTATNLFYFLDANAANYPYRFYRVLQQ